MDHIDPSQNSINIIKEHLDIIHRNLELAADYCDDYNLRLKLYEAGEAFAEFTAVFHSIINQEDQSVNRKTDE